MNAHGGTPSREPTVVALDEPEALEFLAGRNVGRLAIARANRVSIWPIHYAYHDGWIYGRTSQGRKLEMTGPEWWPVAFEVDEVRGMFDWTSVVVHGGFYVLNPSRHWQRAAYETAVEQMRQLLPETLTDTDPTPARVVFFRIAVQEIEGRRATPPREATPARTTAESDGRAVQSEGAPTTS